MKKFRTITLTLFLFITLFTPQLPAGDPNAPVNVADYKPPIRVACLGDSITHGVGAEPGWAYPDQLDRMLGEGWDVRNFGHSGASVGKSDKHAIWGTKEYHDALDFHPDVVVIMLGTNDTKPENWAEKDKFPKLYKDLVVSFQKLASTPRVFCCTAPYVAKKGNFGINEAGVLEQIPMITQVARDWNAGLIDVHAALDHHDELFGDNVHPHTAGATLIAKAVYHALAGKDFSGEIPGPSASLKAKPGIHPIEGAGELSYREAFAMIASTAMPGDKVAPIKEKFDATASIVDAKIRDFESQISDADSQRMKYKHTDPKQAGQSKSKEGELKKDLAKYKRESLNGLITMVPEDYRGKFGTEWLNKYILDRLAPIATTLTPAQLKQIREICVKEGDAFGKINNTPERSIEEVKAYGDVYISVLDVDQKKRVEPK